MSSNLHHKNSDHLDIYSKMSIKDREVSNSAPSTTSNEEQEMYYKFQKNMSLNKQYETFLEMEKSIKEIGTYMSKEPMDQVARKMRKGQQLTSAELEAWIQYNFLAFPE